MKLLDLRASYGGAGPWELAGTFPCMDGVDALNRSGEPMRCPTDGSRLVEVERTGVLIDACPTCRGVWLDRGELDKILVKERQMMGGDPDDDFLREVEGKRPAPQRRAPEPHHDERSYKKKKRKSLLEDLLDFG